MSTVVRNRQIRPVLGAGPLGRVARLAFAAAGLEDGNVGVAFVADDEMCRLHDDFMGLATTTDVLSFSGGDDEDPVYRGDVVICTDQAARQARDYRIGYTSELVVLALHGFLHLVGFDHSLDDGRMRRVEAALLPLAVRELRP